MDIKAKEMYHEVRALGVPPSVTNDPQIKHIYFLAMIFTLYSIKSEVYMPYILTETGSKFQWENFKNKHEKLDGDQLQEILNTLSC